MERRKALKEKSSLRRELLRDSYILQQFERDCDETKGWINEKLKFATDESYLDPTNLGGKIQKHQNFEQELNANKSRMEDIRSTGQELIETKHYASRKTIFNDVFNNDYNLKIFRSSYQATYRRNRGSVGNIGASNR